MVQQSCGLHRHLDGVPPDTPIRDIVDRCRVRESHSELKGPDVGVDLEQGPLDKSEDFRDRI